MAVPTEISFSSQRLEHQLPHHFPIGREFEVVYTEFLHGPLGVCKDNRPEEQVIKTYYQWFHAEVLDQRIEGPGRVFSSTERHYAIIIILALVLTYEFLELLFLLFPVYLLILDDLIITDITYSFIIECNGLLCFRHDTLGASFELMHLFQH